MMEKDNEHRLSTVEANVQHFNDSMKKIEGYVGRLFEQNGEIKTGLALVVQNQDDMKDYQETCDKERKDHEKRITECEGFQSRLMKVSSSVSGVIALIVTAGIEWVCRR